MTFWVYIYKKLSYVQPHSNDSKLIKQDDDEDFDKIPAVIMNIPTPKSNSIPLDNSTTAVLQSIPPTPTADSPCPHHQKPHNWKAKGHA